MPMSSFVRGLLFIQLPTEIISLSWLETFCFLWFAVIKQCAKQFQCLFVSLLFQSVFAYMFTSNMASLWACVNILYASVKTEPAVITHICNPNYFFAQLTKESGRLKSLNRTISAYCNLVTVSEEMLPAIEPGMNNTGCLFLSFLLGNLYVGTHDNPKIIFKGFSVLYLWMLFRLELFLKRMVMWWMLQADCKILRYLWRKIVCSCSCYSYFVQFYIMLTFF